MVTRPVIGVVGLGRMGRGIAHAFAFTGHDVRLIDLKPREAAAAATLADAAMDEVERTVRLVLDLTGSTADPEAILGRVACYDEAAADAALAGCDLIFEGVPEVLEMKLAAFARISAAARLDALIASTTSTIMADDLAPSVTHPERFLNAHWLNPAFLIPLVEVSPASGTAPAAVERLTAILAGAGKEAVVCKSAPGFIVPRIQTLAMNEAARIVADGIATAEAVDRATRLGFGLRFAILGLTEFIDWGGGDILYYASDYLTRATGADRYAAPDIINKNMAEGAIGMHAGRGFHDYAGRDIAAYQRETMARFVGLLTHLGLMRRRWLLLKNRS